MPDFEEDQEEDEVKTSKFKEEKFIPHFETPIEAISFSARPLERWFEKYEPKVSYFSF